MKKYSNSLVLWAMTALMVCSCAKNETTSEPVKVADYLYELTLENYCDTMPNELAMKMGTEFGCSAVRSGNFYGRNLDYFISEVPEFVVHTTAAEGRHATVGVCRLEGLTDEMVKQGLSKEQLDILPWSMMDGVNDAGLVCNVNVVPIEDCGNRKPTNPGKPVMSSTLAVRAMLDNCANVDEAIEFLQNHSVVPFDKGGFDLHFMVADPDKTVIVEFVDDSMVVMTDSIMTNFLVCSLPDITPHGEGVERYQILKENLAEAGSMQGMWNLLKRARYSQTYDIDLNPFWVSEFAGKNIVNTMLADSIKANPIVRENCDKFKAFMETGKYDPKDGLWHTTHNSTYDIAKRALWVTVHEDYDNHYEFTLK